MNTENIKQSGSVDEAEGQARFAASGGSGTAYAILTAIALVASGSGVVFTLTANWHAGAIVWNLATACLWLRTFAKQESPNDQAQARRANP